MKQKMNILSALLLCLTAGILAALALQPAEMEKVHTAAPYPAAKYYEQEMEARFSKIVFGEAAVKREYFIDDNALTAPVPNPECYGEADSPAQLGWLLEKAAELLDGQTMYFSTDTEIFPGSTVHYYLDDTILAITWKQVFRKAVFTFSEVKLVHPSQFRRHLSDGEFGSGKLYLTTEMSKSVNAVVACSGDYYAYRRKGVTVYNGTVCRALSGVNDACYIDKNGDMILERGLKFETPEEAQAYADEHDIQFSLSFGPILIQDGELVCPKKYALGEVTKGFPRAALCQMDSLHYLYAVSNMEVHYYDTMTMPEFAECLLTTGCRQAYALDGGQTATVVMNNALINRVNYGSERLISDIIYFATAIPEGA